MTIGIRGGIRRSHARRALTLAELVVVVAILGVLAALLVPAASAARAQARTRVCQSNLRQLTMGWLSYASDHGDMLPGSTDDFVKKVGEPTVRICWLGTLEGSGGRDTENVPSKGTLFPYVDGNRGIYLCPDAKLRTGLAAELPYSYTAPVVLSGAPVALLERSRWVTRRDSTFDWSSWSRGVMRADAHSSPWLLIEEDPEAHLESEDDSVWSNRDMIADRHQGKGAVSHLDGHVSVRTYARGIYPMNAWASYYELTDGRFINNGYWYDARNSMPITFGYIRDAGITNAVLPD